MRVRWPVRVRTAGVRVVKSYVEVARANAFESNAGLFASQIGPYRAALSGPYGSITPSCTAAGNKISLAPNVFMVHLSWLIARFLGEDHRN